MLFCSELVLFRNGFPLVDPFLDSDGDALTLDEELPKGDSLLDKLVLDVVLNGGCDARSLIPTSLVIVNCG